MGTFGQAAWSPAGRSLFLSSGTSGHVLVDAASLSAREISLPWQTLGLTWVDESVLIAATAEGVYRFRADGGTPAALPSESGQFRSRPSMLPDGRRYLFLLGTGIERDLCVGAIDTPQANCIGKAARFVYGRGHVVLIVGPEGRLLGQTFDADAGALTGAPIELAAAVSINPSVDSSFMNTATVSSNGLVAFLPPSSSAQADLVWFDRLGKRQSRAIEPGPGQNFDMSPDGRLAASAAPIGADAGVYVLDLTRGVRTRLNPDSALDVVLSPDGASLAYVRGRDLVVQGVGGGTPRVVQTVESPKQLSAEDWSRDGQFIVGLTFFGSQRDIVAIPLDGSTPPQALVSGLNLPDEMRLSPDGRWLAFNAQLSNRHEVYVTPVPPTGERLQLSVSGGVSPRWRDDGRELFYLDLEGRLMAVAVDPGTDRLAPTRPTALFSTAVDPPTYNMDHFEPGPGGKTFLFSLPVIRPDVRTTLLVNWFPR